MWRAQKFVGDHGGPAEKSFYSDPNQFFVERLHPVPRSRVLPARLPDKMGNIDPIGLLVSCIPNTDLEKMEI